MFMCFAGSVLSLLIFKRLHDRQLAQKGFVCGGSDGEGFESSPIEDEAAPVDSTGAAFRSFGLSRLPSQSPLTAASLSSGLLEMTSPSGMVICSPSALTISP